MLYVRLLNTVAEAAAVTRTQGAAVVAWWTGCCTGLWRGEKGRGVERREKSRYACEVAAVEGMVGKREREMKILEGEED